MLFLLACITVGAGLGMTIAWVHQRRIGNATIVDAYWTFLVTIAGIVALALGDGDATRRLIVGLMLAMWGLRLGIYLLQRAFSDAAEDGRYADLRAEKGNEFQSFMLKFLWFQAVTIPFFAIPHLITAEVSAGLTIGLGVAIALYAVGWLIQTQADQQLGNFRRDPANAGQVCKVGWWGRCRHPNYFGEWLMSIAFACCALAHPVWWIAALAWLLPIVEGLLLRYMTGVPSVEKRALISEVRLTASINKKFPLLFHA